MAWVRLAGAGVAVAVGIAAGVAAAGVEAAGVVAAVGVSSAGTAAAGVALASKMQWSIRSVAAAGGDRAALFRRASAAARDLLGATYGQLFALTAVDKEVVAPYV